MKQEYSHQNLPPDPDNFLHLREAVDKILPAEEFCRDISSFTPDDELNFESVFSSFEAVQNGTHFSEVFFKEQPVDGLAPETSPAARFFDEKSLSNVARESVFNPEIIRNDFPVLHQRVNGKPLIWFDNAATTQKPQAVIDRIKHFYENDNSNIHRASHTLAARSTDAYEGARAKVKNFINASATEEIVFVRGATEGINLITQTYGRKYIQEGDEIIISTLDHHANIVPWQQLAKEKNARLTAIPVNNNGDIIMEEYERLLNPRTKIVSVAHVNNTFGSVLPIRQMIGLAKRYNARFVIDGAQSIAHTRVNVQELGCDFFVFSGHKIYAPNGIGVVYGKKELLDILPPWQGGGNMIKDVTLEETQFNVSPARFEAGTPNVADAAGLGEALDYVSRLGLENIEKYEHELTEYARTNLAKIPGLSIIGNPKERISVVSFVLEGIPTQEVGQLLDKEGIALRAGHHCAQPALRRFGLEATVRPSFSFYNTKAEIDRLVEALRKIQAGYFLLKQTRWNL